MEKRRFDIESLPARTATSTTLAVRQESKALTFGEKKLAFCGLGAVEHSYGYLETSSGQILHLFRARVDWLSKLTIYLVPENEDLRRAGKDQWVRVRAANIHDFVTVSGSALVGPVVMDEGYLWAAGAWRA